MAIVDTSVLMPMFDIDHPNHRRARAQAAKHTIWHVTPGVLGETTQALRRKAIHRGQDGNAIARRTLETLEESESYRPLGDYDAPFVSRIFQLDGGLSFIDAWGVALALQRVEPLATLDHRQEKALARFP